MAKKRADSHLQEALSLEILRQSIPDEWVIRYLNPDYGVDLVIEIFESSGPSIPTLGEFLFVQLKSKKGLAPYKLAISEEMNTEMYRKITRERELEVDVFRVQLDFDTIDNARLMGPAQPLMLFLADVETGEIHFLCITDYCDKMLEPSGFFNYARRQSKTVYVPVFNRLSTPSGLEAIRFYALRAKLYAVFSLAHYQYRSLENLIDNELGGPSHEHEFTSILKSLRMIGRFANRLQGMPIWDQTQLWAVLEENKRLLATAVELCEVEHQIFKRGVEAPPLARVNTELVRNIEDCTKVWESISRMGLLFEDVVRHWWLPTALGQLSSGDPRHFRQIGQIS